MIKKPAKDIILEDLRQLPRRAFAKTIFSTSLGLLATLYYCPQLGMNPFNTDDHLQHYFMSLSTPLSPMILCGMFCSFLMLLSTQLFTFLFLDHYELLWIQKRYAFTSLVPSLLWFVSMITQSVEGLYLLGWILAASLVTMIFYFGLLPSVLSLKLKTH